MNWKLKQQFIKQTPRPMMWKTAKTDLVQKAIILIKLSLSTSIYHMHIYSMHQTFVYSLKIIHLNCKKNWLYKLHT